MIAPPTYRLVRPPSARPARPTAEQRRVIDHGAGPMLVLGPAGSGKTWALVEAAATRLERSPEAVLVIADAAAVARRLRQSLAARAPGVAGRADVTTWLALSWRLVHQAEPGWRLIGAGEQELRLRDLASGQPDADWPQAWAEFRRTPAFARHVRRALALLRRQGVALAEVAEAGQRGGRAQWRGLARLGEDYRAVLALEGAVDFDGLVDRAVEVAEAAGPGAAGAFGAVCVEHYEEAEPSHVRLLAALAEPGGTVAAFADPRQATGAFRGTESRSALDFPERFRGADGRRAAVVELVAGGVGLACARGRQTPELRRVIEGWERRRPWPAQPAATVVGAEGPPAGGAGAGLSAGAPGGGGPAPEFGAATSGSAGAPGGGPGQSSGGRSVGPGVDRAAAVKSAVEVVVAESPGAEADWVAGWLRARRLEGLPWGDMAVIVRSGWLIEPLASALAREGVPTEVTWTDLPLAAEPVVARLLGALTIEPEQSVADALWQTWQASGLPGRIEAGLAAGPVGRLAAERDLDAACALFDVAHERVPWRGPSAAAAFREEVMGRTAPAGRSRSLDQGRGVAVLTAHRAKGREWAAVAVAGVREGTWPALRRDRDLFGLADLTDDGRLGPPAWQERLAAERRLFHVAIGRARRRLLVSAAWDPATDIEPSRFLDELGPGRRLVERPGPDLTTPTGLVGCLRRAAVDPLVHPTARQAALLRLADLADAVDARGRPVAPAARPENWWPVARAEPRSRPPGGGPELVAPASPTAAMGSPMALSGLAVDGSSLGLGGRPDLSGVGPGSGEGSMVSGVGPGSLAREDDTAQVEHEIVSLSGSHVDGLLTCPRQWFLSRRARADRSRSPQALFGSILHAVVQRLAAGRVDRAGAEAELDAVWDDLGFAAAWQGTAERTAATSALDRFEVWRRAQAGRALVALEAPFATALTLGPWSVRLTGRLDWLDRDDEGRLRVVDFKTGRSAPSGPEAARHRQLGAYQLAVASGGGDWPAGSGPAVVSGAELVFLRLDGPEGAKTLRQPSLTERPYLQPPPVYLGLSAAGLARVGRQEDHPTWVHHAVAAAAQTLAEGRFPALPQAGCRWCPFQLGCPAHEDGAP